MRNHKHGSISTKKATYGTLTGKTGDIGDMSKVLSLLLHVFTCYIDIIIVVVVVDKRVLNTGAV